MRIGIVILAAALLPSAALSQGEIEIWPGVTSFTSRGNIGSSPTGGEILQGLNTTVFTGLGDQGGADGMGRVTGFRMLLQDQNRATQETYHVVFRSGSDAAGPGPNNGALRAEIGPFTSPGGAPGGAAWLVTQSLGKVNALSLCDYNAFGVKLSPIATWASDGLSCHASRGDGANAKAVQHASSAAPNMAWQIRDTGSGWFTSNVSAKRSWRMRVLTDAATLQMGAGGANDYGVGGAYPATSEPLRARARYGSTSGVTTSLLFLSAGKKCPGIKFQPGMRIYLDPLVLVGPFGATPSGGQAIHALGTSPATSPNITVHFQAAGVTSGSLILTNLCTMTL